MATTRDLTEREFLAALRRHGFTIPRYGIPGYVECPSGVRIYRYNAGNRRRDQLRYLLAEEKKWRARKEEPTDAPK